jgi:hypothetical protein
MKRKTANAHADATLARAKADASAANAVAADNVHTAAHTAARDAANTRVVTTEVAAAIIADDAAGFDDVIAAAQASDAAATKADASDTAADTAYTAAYTEAAAAAAAADHADAVAVVAAIAAIAVFAAVASRIVVPVIYAVLNRRRGAVRDCDRGAHGALCSWAKRSNVREWTLRVLRFASIVLPVEQRHIWTAEVAGSLACAETGREWARFLLGELVALPDHAWVFRRRRPRERVR